MIKMIRNLQKIISISILLTMAISAFPVFATEQANVTLSDKTVYKDGDGIVTVDLSWGNPVPAIAMNFTIKYDTSKLEIVEQSDVKLNNLLITEWSSGVNLTRTGEIYIIASSSNNRSITNEVPPIKLASIKFKVKSTATLQTIPLVFGTTDTETAIGEKVNETDIVKFPLNLKDGSISVVNKTGGNNSSGGNTTPATPSVSPSPSPVVTPSPSPVVTQPTETPFKSKFKDLGGHDWAKEAITELEKANIVTGEGDKFRPGDNITRAEFAKLVVVAFKLQMADNSAEFNDVKADEWFAKFISIAASNGVVKGYDGGIYDPNKQITREELCVMVVRAAKAIGLELPSGTALNFTDSDTIEDYAKDSVAILTGLGIVNGKGNGLFAPKDNATRAESSKIIFGIFKMLSK